MHTDEASKQSWPMVVVVAIVLGTLGVAGGMAWIPSSNDMADIVCGLDRLLVQPDKRLRADEPDPLVCGARVTAEAPQSGISEGLTQKSGMPWAASMRL
jgi:hypothetical protein